MWITEIYTIIVVVLKLIGVIEWSWWVVFLPETIAIVLYMIASIAFIGTMLKVEKRIDEVHKRIQDKLGKWDV